MDPTNGTPPTAEAGDVASAIITAQRSIDHAVMSMFELAFSLEALSSAIQQLKAEKGRELRERQNAIIGVDDLL
jgi:hypothetical protein